MGRIAKQFEILRGAGRKGLIPFVTAGDPTIETSLEIVLKLAEMGSTVIELGVPFSDPMADGPAIQRSSQRALDNGIKLKDVLKIVSRLRERTSVPIVLFSYLNPLFRYGLEQIAKDAASVGVDGLLITDAVDDDAEELSAIFGGSGIDLISLIAPTTSDTRLSRIAANSRGFLYAVSRTGVTGTRTELDDTAERLVRRARAVTNLPVAVGFGISTREHIQRVWQYADAAVVGSAIVEEIQEHPTRAVSAVEAFVRQLVPEFANSEVEL